MPRPKSKKNKDHGLTFVLARNAKTGKMQYFAQVKSAGGYSTCELTKDDALQMLRTASDILTGS